MGTWTYSVNSAVPGLLSSPPGPLTPQPDPNGDGGEQLVVPLSDAVFVGGFSGAIELSVTPPNHATANDTTWPVTPTLSGGALGSVTAPTPVTATATATLEPALAASASQAPGSADTVTDTLTPTCDPRNALGDEWPTSGTLVDQLPAGTTYESATDGGTYDPSAGTVTWTFTSAADLPPGCASSAGGASTDSVSVGFSSGTTASALVDHATLSLEGVGAATATATASASPVIPGGPSAPPVEHLSRPAPAVGSHHHLPGQADAMTGTGQTYDINVSCWARATPNAGRTAPSRSRSTLDDAADDRPELDLQRQVRAGGAAHERAHPGR